MVEIFFKRGPAPNKFNAYISQTAKAVSTKHTEHNNPPHRV